MNKVVSAAEGGHIDDPLNLKDSNVFVFCGAFDPIVNPSKSNSVPYMRIIELCGSSNNI